MRTEVLKLLVAAKFPYPIAYSFRRALDHRDSREDLVKLFQTTVDYLGQALVVDLLSREERDEELHRELARLLHKPLSVGVWVDWVLRILKVYRKRSWTPLVGDLSRLLHRAFQRRLLRLVETRNRWAHGSFEFPLAPFRAELFELLERIQTVHKASLFAIDSARRDQAFHVFRAKLLRGDNPSLPEIVCRSNITLETEKVYLYEGSSREVLSMDPFVLYASCDECEERHYFQFNGIKGQKAIYSAVEHGHTRTGTDGFLQLERLLRHDRAYRTRPRHFAIPGEFAGLPRSLHPGDAVGPYRVEELIRLGAMSQVYRATDTRDGRSYALKLLPLELSRDPVLLLRFEEEAHKLKLLDHPNVCAMRDFGEDLGDRYLVLDLALSGRIGAQTCLDLGEARKPLSEDQIISIGKQVCEGLQHVHSRGIVHRDLKPGNLLLQGDRVLITDFGISRGRGDHTITLTGLPVGTPEYMSPEQIQQGDIDHRSDLYSLACVLYELGTGRPPYRADTPLTTALYHLQTKPPRAEALNPRLSVGLGNIIFKGLQKDPEQRYQGAQELFDDLSTVDSDPAGPQELGGQKTPQDSLEELRLQERARFRRRLALAGLCSIVIAFLVLGGAQALHQSWTLLRLTGEAREAWERGPEHWERACQLLREALLVDAQHRRVKRLIADVRSKGTLVVHIRRGPARLRIRPTDSTTHPGLRPEVLSGATEFSSGEPLRLTLGPYSVRVSPEDGRPDFSFPVFVTQVEYREDPDRPETWKRDRRLLPEEILDREPQVESDLETFRFAERFEVKDFILPGSLPPGYSLVNPGPFFQSEPDLTKPLEEIGAPYGEGKASVYETGHLVADDLQFGFLIARNETTLGEFRRWFDDFGAQYCDWMAEQARVLENWTNLKKLKSSVRNVPLDVQMEGWRDTLRERGVDPATIASSDELMDAVFRKELDAAREEWSDYHDRLAARLAEETDPSHAARFLDREIALAYARTHAPVLAGEFKAWVGCQIDQSADLVTRLRELTRKLKGSEDKFLDLDWPELTLQVGHRSGLTNRGGMQLTFSKRSILHAYNSWRTYDVFYAAQVPVGVHLEWFRIDKKLQRHYEETPDEIEAELRSPTRWLFDRARGGTPYARIVHPRPSHTPRTHFLEWLEREIRDEEERKELFDRLLERFATMNDGEEVGAKMIPWEVRVEYGWDIGWDLPTSRQWEKALRGADTRVYPWGNDPRSLGVPGTFFPISWVTNDRSPYQVSGLAGGVSEWVIQDFSGRSQSGFLKGGNQLLDIRYLGGRVFIGADRRSSWPWSGVRVVRLIRDTASGRGAGERGECD